MPPKPSVLEAIGNTPLIKLRHASEATGCTILGKAEFMNPGGSVKDRAGLFIIEDAMRRGALKPGGTVVEGTAGNTGIGLALVANALGFRTVIVIPETQSQEKKDMLRLQGAELIEVPAVPYKNPNNYVKLSGRLAERLAGELPNGAVWANQFDNVANRAGHEATTGREIWEQTEGKVDGFTCAVGTGGTLAGVAAGAEGQEPRDQDRPDRPAGLGALRLGRARRAAQRGQLDHRRDRAGQGDGEPGGHADRPRLPRLGRGGAADRVRSRRARRAAARRLERASTSPARCISPASWGRATRS